MTVLVVDPQKIEVKVEVNVDNPWPVEHTSAFLKYCCPECDYKNGTLKSFEDHALENHENAKVLFANEEHQNVQSNPITQEDSSKQSGSVDENMTATTVDPLKIADLNNLETSSFSMEEPPIKKTKWDFKSTASNSISIENLPREILCIIFSYLDKKSVQNSTATCNLWFKLIRGNSNLSSHICFKIVKLSKLLIVKLSIYQNVKLTGARWPVLKKVEFVDPVHCMYLCHSCNHGEPCVNIYRAEKIELYSLRLVDPKECSTLEEIIISGAYCLTKTLPEFPRLLNGTIKELTFSVKDDLESIQVEHVTSLSLLLNLKWTFQETQEKT